MTKAAQYLLAASFEVEVTRINRWMVTNNICLFAIDTSTAAALLYPELRCLATKSGDNVHRIFQQQLAKGW